MKTITESIHELLTRGESLVLATVISQKGSTPRSSGSKMIVRSDGRIIGTIGGGGMEGEVIRSSLSMFEDKAAEIKPFILDGAPGRQINSICGGTMEVLVEWVEANSANLDFYRNLLTMAERGKAWLLTALPEPGRAVENVRRCLIQEEGPTIGDISLSDSDLRRIKTESVSKKASLLTLEDRSFWTEPISPPVTVYLFGAGHVAREVAVIADFTDFRTVVIDDREEFANAERFETADRILVPESFESCFETLSIYRNDYMLILTRGHNYDRIILAQSLKTEAGYIGMIASRKKAKAIYKDLLSQGFSQSDLDRVYSPVGLDIKAETPQEIAVSIVAQLISVRAR